jgi:four helix bundle protein
MLEKFDAFQISKEFYWSCKELKLPTDLRAQLTRASSSIALNLAEGSGKRTPKDQAKSYSIALGSLRECQSILQLEKINDPQLQEQANRLGAILFKLSKKAPKTTNRTGTGTGTATTNAEPSRK